MAAFRHLRGVEIVPSRAGKTWLPKQGQASADLPGFGSDPGVRSMFDILGDTVDDKVFFAGEATNDDGATGTVIGAMETGDRAANEINDVVEAPANDIDHFAIGILCNANNAVFRS